MSICVLIAIEVVIVYIAFTCFSNNYGTCIQNLVELESSIGVDPCIIHNKAVAEFYKSDFKNFEQFHKILNQLIGKVGPENNVSTLVKALSDNVFVFHSTRLLTQTIMNSKTLKWQRFTSTKPYYCFKCENIRPL